MTHNPRTNLTFADWLMILGFGAMVTIGMVLIVIEGY